MGSIDLSSIMNDIMLLVLLPSLVGVLGNTGLVNLGPAAGIFNAFLSILPVIVLFNMFGDMFRGVGGSAGRVLDSFMNILMLIVVFPALIGSIGSIVPGLGGVSGIFNVFMQLLPLLLIFQLFGEFFKGT